MYLCKFNIDIDYMVKTTCTDVNLLQEQLRIPEFWAQVFGYANECKSIINKKLINKSDLLSEPLWFNNRLKISKKVIFMPNWTKSGILYIKDVFDNSGAFLSENALLGRLVSKSNWICELLKVKRVLNWIINNVDTSISSYIQIRKTWVLVDNNTRYCMKTQKCKFYYDILVGKKCEKNYMEKSWERLLNLDNIDWAKVYENQVWDITDRKLGEFNYCIKFYVILSLQDPKLVDGIRILMKNALFVMKNKP